VKDSTVTGIIKDPPENTSFKFSFLAPLRSHIYYTNEWNTSNSHTFMILADGTQPAQVEEKLPDLLKKYQEVSLWTDFHQEEYLLQPLNEYHLENKVNDDVGLKGNPQQVRIFSIVAVLVLLLGSINYMNLAIARSMNRTQEVGLRKVIGAKRGQLIDQFLGESTLLTFIALLVALGMLIIFLPFFSELVERPLELNLYENWFLF
jgi:putative ABC transport system permease protein